MSAAKSDSARRPRRAPRPPYPHPLLDGLEPRQLLSAAVQVGSNVNVSRLPANQAEATIAINRRRPNELFAASNMEEVAREDPDLAHRALFTASSFDGGKTWRRRVIADGNDNLPPGHGDPTAAYDTHGNLFFAYLMRTAPDDSNSVALLVSRDNGRSFRTLRVFEGALDQPTVTASGGSIWLSWRNYDLEAVEIVGAPISSSGKVGAFTDPEQVEGSTTGNYADLAIGPKGQVIVTYQDPEDGEGPTTIFAASDPDGVGPARLTPPTLVSTTQVGGFETIPAQAYRTIDAEPGVVFDRSRGPFTGRAYLVYTDETPDESDNTEILLRYSDNNGASWSAPTRVNDDRTKNSQFFPRAQLDQTTGQLAIVWHDARNDRGVPGKGSTNNVPNDDAQLWATVVTPSRRGLQIGRNFRVSAGASNADAAQSRIDYGDYTGVDFYKGVFYPVWADNSNATRDNPDGTLNAFDVYTARVRVATSPFDRGGNHDDRDDRDERPDVRDVLQRLLDHLCHGAR